MTDSASITLTARQWRELIAPVLPFAGNDYMLPVLNAVHVRTEGKWLIATASDRFRVGVKRIAKVPTDEDATTTWPAFQALIPLPAVKSIGAMLKPTRGLESGATFTVDDDNLVVEAAGAFVMFDAARFTHRLATGEFPDMRKLIHKALNTPDEERGSRISVNPAFLADFKSSAGRVIRILLPARMQDPLLLTDDEGFLGLLMPRRSETDAESWDDIFGEVPAKVEPEPEPTKPARKPRAKKTAAVA